MRFAEDNTADWRDCQGKGALGCLGSLLILVVMIVVGSRVAPPYFSYKSLQADVGTEISKAGAHYFTDEVLVQNIVDVAKKNEVRLKRDDVKVERFAGQVQVSVQYHVPVDLIIFQHTFEFNIKASSYIGTL